MCVRQVRPSQQNSSGTVPPKSTLSELNISHSRMNSMSQIINAHNSKIPNREYTENDKILCNCRNRNNCPLDDKCLFSKIV